MASHNHAAAGRPTYTGNCSLPGAVKPMKPSAKQDRPLNWNTEYCKNQAPLNLYLQRIDGRIGCVFNAKAQNDQTQATEPTDGQSGKKKKMTAKAKTQALKRVRKPQAFVTTRTRGFKYPDVLEIEFKRLNNEPLGVITFPREGCTLRLNLKATSHTIDITVERGGFIEDRLIFLLQYSQVDEAKNCKKVWSHLARSFTVSLFDP
jgi:hypothetical protein